MSASTIEPPAGPPPGSHPSVEPRESLPAMLVLAVVTAIILIVSLSNRISDPDLWQHLVVGKAIWHLRQVPTHHLWTWPSYGMPDVLPSWLYRAILWPFWKVGDVPGYYALRWSLALAAFGIAYATARRMGARGLSTFVLLTMCAGIYRRRSERPEMLAAVLLVLVVWILEGRRHGGRDRSAWLIPLLWAWVNAHISYFFGFAIVAFHLVNDAWQRQRRAAGAPPAAATRRLLIVAALGVAASMINPFGWKTLWQPFDFFLHSRNEPIFANIGELKPIYWSENWTNGLPVLMLGWPLLLAWRARRRGLDLVELSSCLFFTAVTLLSQRFMAFYALVAIPFVARALTEWLASRGPILWRTPKRIAIAIAACGIVWLPEAALYIRGTLGLEYVTRAFPVAACDFIARENIRGRSFNPFHWGGYMLYRFWPDRQRLPFIDIHQTGTREDRLLYMIAQVDSAGWQTIDRKFHFDYVLYPRPMTKGGRLLDVLDRDSTWALVFVDDVSAVFAHKTGPLAETARRLEYRWMVAGTEGLDALRLECQRNPAACVAIEAELERAIAASTRNADAHSLLANLALMDGRYDRAKAELKSALAANPYLPRAHWRLALVAREQNRPADAVRELLAQRQMDVETPGMSLELGTAYQKAGDLRRALESYRWAVRREPDNLEARDSVLSVARRIGR